MARPIINDQIISIPPYVATTWKNVQAVYMESTELCLKLEDGTVVRIPEPTQELTEQVFACHTRSIELASRKSEEAPPRQRLRFPLGNPLSFGLGDEEDAAAQLGFGSMGSMLQHNPAQANIPDIPDEILFKIAGIAKVLAPEELESIPYPEPECNCMFCQISRAIHEEAGVSGDSEMDGEEVYEEELHFRDSDGDDVDSRSNWRIEELGDKMYRVTNVRDHTEQYQVYLGDPIGCTCGESGCEHIRAVLIT